MHDKIQFFISKFKENLLRDPAPCAYYLPRPYRSAMIRFRNCKPEHFEDAIKVMNKDTDKTLIEKLQTAIEIGNAFMPMGRVYGIRFEFYPHTEGDGFRHGEMAWEVSANHPRGGAAIHFTRKTPEEAIDELLTELRQCAADRAEDQRRQSQQASYWDDLAKK